MRGIFVTGTDTGVGKTLVSTALILWARARGANVGGMKPAESGCARVGGRLVPADAELLRRAAGGEDDLERVCPHRLEAPLAPGVAAAREGVEVSLERAREALRALCAAHPDGVVVEGAGGLLLPMDAEFRTVADWIAEFGLPALVVARGGLGTINHTALTLEALAARRIVCRGVVLVARTAEEEAAAAANAEAIRRLAGAPILAIVPPLPAPDPFERARRAAQVLEREFAGRKLDPADLFA